MKIAIMIHSHQSWKNTTDAACHLASCIQPSDHHLLGVFFYGSAANIINDAGRTKQWIEANLDCPLWICQTMIEQQAIKPPANTPFTVAGMAAWLTAISGADQVVNLA